VRSKCYRGSGAGPLTGVEEINFAQYAERRGSLRVTTATHCHRVTPYVAVWVWRAVFGGRAAVSRGDNS